MNQDPQQLSEDILEGKVDIATLFPEFTPTPLNDEDGIQLGIVQVNNRIISFDERVDKTAQLHNRLEKEFGLDTIGTLISHGQMVLDFQIGDLAYVMCQNNGVAYTDLLRNSRITELIMMPPEEVDEQDQISYMESASKYLENAGVPESMRGKLGTKK